ncbi:hypothetical protein C2S51_003929 [Perilla frutescens var. frutescens]|nr:hypothetical protein C2S51_003929 [Perilla frutescens var. frutescens]
MIFDKAPMQTNLECFLDCTTPVVPSQFLSKSEMRRLNRLWHPWEREKVDYFTLSDLWNSFDEWSACGAGVPVISDDGQKLIQYFVPYLSAIQIFTSHSSANCLRWDRCSSEEGMSEHDSFWHPNGRLGNLYFQYFEKSSPYGRVPLVDKIGSLVQTYPGLMSLRSVDLSPASWMAVAWYPIYHIPAGRTVKDLQTCFLTYHTLSSSFQDMDLEEEDGENVKRKRKERESLGLTPFGLATYKLQGDVWASDKMSRDRERLVSLVSVADSWLKQLRVQHHDFSYFMGVRLG